MPRGKKADVGDTRIARNGYHYTKTEDGWKLTHRLIMEQELGRALRGNERVRFVDGDRTNLEPDNLEVFEVKQPSKEAKRAKLEAQIDELKAQLEELI